MIVSNKIHVIVLHKGYGVPVGKYVNPIVQHVSHLHRCVFLLMFYFSSGILNQEMKEIIYREL